MRDNFLKDKIILVTGSSRGIGAACAELLLSEGAKVIVNYLHDQDGADKILKKYKNSHAFKADLRNEEEINKLFNFIKSKFGSLDSLVNNAGTMHTNMIATTKEKDINDQIEINIKAPFYCLRKAARVMMRKQSGSIVNISSIMGIFGASGHVIYSSTKGALQAMTLSASKELGPHGIRVNAVAPGLIDTSLINHISQEQREALTKNIALGRIGNTEDVAKVVGFLCSDWSNYISGQIIRVDGDMILPLK